MPEKQGAMRRRSSAAGCDGIRPDAAPTALGEGPPVPTQFFSQRSIRASKGGGGTSLDCPVPVGHCGGMRLGEKVPSLVRVTGGLALSEHPSPQEVCPGGKERRTHPVAQRGGLGEVGVRLVVAAEDSGESTEIVTDRTKGRGTGGRQLIGPRGEPVAQRNGALRVPALDGGLGKVDHSGQPDL